MAARGLFQIAFPIVLGLALILARYRSRMPRRDLMLFVVPAVVAAWSFVQITMMSPPTGSRLANTLLLLLPLSAAFFFLASRWRGILTGHGQDVYGDEADQGSVARDQRAVVGHPTQP